VEIVALVFWGLIAALLPALVLCAIGRGES
jgi:hypothetical protein